MPEVKKFSQEMIKQYLEGKSLRYLTDPDGDYVVQFSRDEEIGCELTILLMAAGQDKDIFVVRVMSDIEIPRTDWPQAVQICNEWNRDRRWPKVFLNNQENSPGRIICEEQIDLQEGVHQELLDDFANTVVASTFQFWKWAHQDKGL